MLFGSVSENDCGFSMSRVSRIKTCQFYAAASLYTTPGPSYDIGWLVFRDTHTATRN
jgi:hypothetical protein